MVNKSEKITEAETFVDNYIISSGQPPTYEIVAEALGISKTAAFARCAKFRDKMKRHKPCDHPFAYIIIDWPYQNVICTKCNSKIE